jgi:hypothetical protein
MHPKLNFRSCCGAPGSWSRNKAKPVGFGDVGDDVRLSGLRSARRATSPLDTLFA